MKTIIIFKEQKELNIGENVQLQIATTQMRPTNILLFQTQGNLFVENYAKAMVHHKGKNNN